MQYNKIDSRIYWREYTTVSIDFYNNLKMGSNRKNLNYISKEVSKNNLKNLSRIRIFDILWWSYLKAEKLREEIGINWSTIRY